MPASASFLGRGSSPFKEDLVLLSAPRAHHEECLQGGVRVYIAVGWGGPGCTEWWCPRWDKSHGLFDFLTKLSGYLQDGWCLCDLTSGQVTPRPTVDLFPTVPSGWGQRAQLISSLHHARGCLSPGAPLGLELAPGHFQHILLV